MTSADGIWVVIPVKPFAQGKSRLSLPLDDRFAINRAFFDHVLAVSRDVVPGRNILVISRDEAALAAARRGGARALREEEEGDLNDALAIGAQHADQRGARGTLSLFADLPYLGADDLEAMISAFDGDNLVIAPDERGSGSNAMLMAPGAFPYRHGTASFWRHLDAARERGAGFDVIRRSGLMRDIDTPADLAALRADEPAADRMLHHHD